MTPASVLGVLAVCWVYSPTLHSCKPRSSWAPLALCKVCKVCVRARACMKVFISNQTGIHKPFSLYARIKNPYTPYTPYTDALKALVLLGLLCVGFVLGWGFLCWVGSAEGEKGHD